MVQLCASLQGHSQSRQDVACQAPAGCQCPARACLSLPVGNWAAGGRGTGVLLFPFSTEASRTVSDCGLQSPPEPGTASQGQLWEWCAWPKDCQGFSSSLPTPIWAHCPSQGCSPPCHRQLGQVLLMEEYREELTARHLPPFCASQRAEGPAQDARLGSET